MSYSSMTEVEEKAVKELFIQIKDKLDISKILLFGSKARHEANEYSDVDLLVLTRRERTTKDRGLLSDIAADINIDYGVSLACLYYNERDWQEGDSINPVLRDNIVREGIPLVLQ